MRAFGLFGVIAPLLFPLHASADQCESVLKRAGVTKHGTGAKVMKTMAESADARCSSWMNGSLGIAAPKFVNWQQCCINHDIPYWRGGPKEERLKADEELARCVAKAGSPTMGGTMFKGVRIGGVPKTQKGYRWGYGWVENTKVYEDDELRACFRKTDAYKAMVRQAETLRKPGNVYVPGPNDVNRMRNETFIFENVRLPAMKKTLGGL